MRTYFTLALLLVVKTVSAQTDSLLFVSAKWEKQKISKGIVWKHSHFNGLFNARQNVNILEVKLCRKNRIAFGYERQLLKNTSEFAKEARAIAAINGSFFDVKNGGSVDYLKVNDSVIATNRLSASNERARHQRAALVIRKRKLQIAKWDGTADWETRLKGNNILLTGPLLVMNKQAEPLDTGEFNRVRHPRSAIAIPRKKKLLFITIDGRHENAAGMSLYELTSVLRWLHVQQGINLDGGGSTTLWLQPHGVVNYPSDNKKWDHEGERKVANVVLIIP